SRKAVSASARSLLLMTRSAFSMSPERERRSRPNASARRFYWERRNRANVRRSECVARRKTRSVPPWYRPRARARLIIATAAMPRQRTGLVIERRQKQPALFELSRVLAGGGQDPSGPRERRTLKRQPGPRPFPAGASKPHSCQAGRPGHRHHQRGPPSLHHGLVCG